MKAGTIGFLNKPYNRDHFDWLSRQALKAACCLALVCLAIKAQTLPDAASMVALQPARIAVLAEAAFVARFSQCAGDISGNALAFPGGLLLFATVFRTRPIKNSPEGATSDIGTGNTTYEFVKNSAHANLGCAVYSHFECCHNWHSRKCLLFHRRLYERLAPMHSSTMGPRSDRL